jgi:uncharacterized protein YjiS (DUF1127 family)
MAEHALAADRVAQARDAAAAELSDLGLSGEDISQLFKRALEGRGDLSPRHLKYIGVSRATMNNAVRAHRIRTGEA